MKTQIKFQDHDVWQVEAHGGRVLIAPQFGARLLRWEVAGQEVIHWPESANWARVPSIRGGNPILFPFPARHMVDGVIGKWKDAQGVIRSLPMHGFARDAAFQWIDEADPATVRMRLVDTPATHEGYPFGFTFDVVYRLGAGELSVAFETTNTGDAPLPYYAGHHFYFAIPHGEWPEWRLTTHATRNARQNDDGSIADAPLLPQPESLGNPALRDLFHLSDHFTEVIVDHPKTGRRIVLDLKPAAGDIPWYNVTTWYENPDSDFYCVEPWLGLPNAIHHGLGLRWLAPGKKEVAACRIAAGGY